jgi:hypothetical protein
MIPISPALSGGLIWSRNGCRYEVKLNDRVVASLRKTSFWSSDYHAESGCGNWRFFRSGMLGNGVEILDASNASVATFKAGWAGPGAFTFADGQSFLVVSNGCWRPVWKVTTADGELAVQIRTRERTVELEKRTALPESRWLLLVLFVFYRMQQAEEDGAVAAVVAAIS